MHFRPGCHRFRSPPFFVEGGGRSPLARALPALIAPAQGGLREGRPVKLLARELGYANPSVLSRAFTAEVGISPRDWLAGAVEGPEA